MERRPEFTIIAGPNGAGKSRLCPFYVSAKSFEFLECICRIGEIAGCVGLILVDTFGCQVSSVKIGFGYGFVF